MSQNVPPVGGPDPDGPIRRAAARRVVMVTSPGVELSLSDVVTNLATVSAQTGERVAVLSTGGLASPEADPEQQLSPALPWRGWRSTRRRAEMSSGRRPGHLLTGTPKPVEVEELLEDTGVPGVSRLDLRHFVGHPAQVVIRVPEVLEPLQEIVDVVILEVPSYLTVHHGEGLTPFVDVVLVVGERDATTMDQVRRTGAALKRLGAPVIGMALTSAESDAWDVDSEFEAEDEDGPLSGVYDRTEPVRVVPSTDITPAAPVEDRPAVDHALPEA
jgi:hypothetical protein